MGGDAESVIKFISGLGVSGVLVLLVYGILKGWFVTGREHSTLANLYTTLQSDMIAMRGELKSLRDRDTTQQDEIDSLRRQLTQEQSLKIEALQKVEALKARVAELERQVNPTRAVQT